MIIVHLNNDYHDGIGRVISLVRQDNGRAIDIWDWNYTKPPVLEVILRSYASAVTQRYRLPIPLEFHEAIRNDLPLEAIIDYIAENGDYALAKLFHSIQLRRS